MGQQQLLLVILVTIIVGIATVVAINTFSSAADSANVDSVRQDVAQIAASAQGYYLKPVQLGGGGRNFTGITFQGLAFPADTLTANGLTAANANGTYVISGAAADEFTITAYPSSDEAYDNSTLATQLTSTGGAAGTSTVTADNATPLTFQ